jgi:predicted alpha/beta superfamily hydrolase
LYGQHYFDGFIPEMIIVGVTWTGKNANPDSLRARDYTPTNEKRLPQSGGADNFLSFMREELFPFIESNYKAEATDRILMGCSLGWFVYDVYAFYAS